MEHGHAAGDLSERVFRSGAWAFSLRAFNRGMGLVKTFILCRLVLPEDFGILGIALLTTSILETFTVTGMDQALVQRPSEREEFWNTAWMVAALRGGFLFVATFLAAPLVAEFFKRPDSVWVIRVMAAGPLLRGFTNPGVVRFIREIEFKRRFIYDCAITMADFAVALVLGFLYRNVWALALGLLAGQAAGLLVSWVFHPVKVRARFDREAFRELFSFGKWVSASTILNFLTRQGDDIVAGRMLGASALGLYQMAYKISTLPITEVSMVLSDVTFPAYSKLQHSRDQVREAFFRVLRTGGVLFFPLAGMVLALGPDFVRAVLGEKWTPMIPAMQVLAVYGMLGAVGFLLSPALRALGRPDLGTWLQLLKLAIMGSTIFFFTRWWGITGTALSVLLNTAVANPVADYFLLREVRGKIKDFLAALAPGLVLAAAMAGTALIFSSLFTSPLHRLLGGGFGGGVCWLAGLRLISIRAGRGWSEELKSLFSVEHETKEQGR